MNTINMAQNIKEYGLLVFIYYLFIFSALLESQHTWMRFY
jgi:hypothetical protein